MAEFTAPGFLAGHSVDEIYATMRAMLPADIDSSEGSHVWNFLRPTAIVAAELCEAILPQVIMTIFPEWSTGEYLDAHAKARGMERRAATAATGTVTVTGAPGLQLPTDARFATAGTDEGSALEYATTEVGTLSSEGTAVIPVRCLTAGAQGNTGAGTILLVADGRGGITDVTNEGATTGGADAESDESLRERILAYDRDRGTSYVGCPADYKRWAKQVAGVGEVTVEEGYHELGQVHLRITDTTGAPASSTLCQAVYRHIMRPDAPEARLAPVNALLVVEAPDTAEIYVAATVLLTEHADLETVSEAFLTALQAYLPECMEDGVVRLSRVGAILSGVDGVKDYGDLMLGTSESSMAAASIELSAGQLAAISADTVSLEVGAELM